MSRNVPEVQRFSSSTPSPAFDPAAEERNNKTSQLQGRGLEFWSVRVGIVLAATALCYKLAPFSLNGPEAAGLGIFLALVIVMAEFRLRQVGIGGLLGGALGLVWGVFSALIVALIISRTNQSEATKSFLEYAALFAFAYLGLALGSQKGGEFKDSPVSDLGNAEVEAPESIKLLDTSVLIDGRIADICEAHFLDGTLAIPQFVLHELQMVADSSDASKRQRGRRGLEVVQRMQKLPHLEIKILDQDPTAIGDVDHKLVELARNLGAKIVTNDFNLNKVATVQGIAVLNVNQLANALKPVVLPGEPMRVLILREGKEPNQGVAFLDDGTMVVVDGARRLINKSVDILVTSVHQTTAGKMIFGRLDERSDASGSGSRHAAAAATRSNGGSARGDLPSRIEGNPRIVETPQSERGPRHSFPETDPE